MPKIGRFFCFHGSYPVDKSILTDNIELCEEIMAGTDDGVKASFLGREAYLGKKRDEHFRRLDGRLGNIMYRKDRIFSK